MKSFYLIGVLLLTSCAHKLSTNPHYLKSAEYQARPEMSESFIKRSKYNLTEEQISRVLQAKVTIKYGVRLAILNLDGAEDAEVTDARQKAIQELLSKTKGIKDIGFIPSFLIPQPISLGNLRDVTALIQAHYLLLVKTHNRGNFKFKVFSPDEALASSSMEVALVDILTGAIPYTALITGKAKITKSNSDDDFSSYLFIDRAKRLAEDEAFKLLAQDLAQIFQ